MLKLNKSQIHIIKEQLYKAYKQTADKGHRNLNWFDTLINDPFNNNKYTNWYVIPDVAFATVQKYNNSQRLLTRFFEFGWFAVHPRSKIVKTPAVEILIKQLEDYKEGLKVWFNQTVVGFEKGALNMVAVGIAIAVEIKFVTALEIVIAI